MPSGKPATKEQIAYALNLKSIGLSYKVITIRTGICYKTLRRICRQVSQPAKN